MDVNEEARELADKLGSVQDASRDIMGDMKGVATATASAADNGTEIATAMDAGSMAASQLEGSVNSVNLELSDSVGATDALDTSIKGASTSLGTAAGAAVDLDTGLDSAVISARSVEQAMIRVAQAAQLAAQAVAQASSMGSAMPARNGGPTMRYFAIGGPLSRGHDNQVIMAQPGERIVSARNARRFATELQAMNAGSKPVYRDHGGPVTNIGDINVSVSQGETSSQTAREIASALRRELRRGTSRLS